MSSEYLIGFREPSYTQQIMTSTNGTRDTHREAESKDDGGHDQTNGLPTTHKHGVTAYTEGGAKQRVRKSATTETSSLPVKECCA